MQQLLAFSFYSVEIARQINCYFKWRGKLMTLSFDQLATLLLPWGFLLLVILIGYQLVSWARKQRSGAYIFGALVQMLLPDPYIERTIQVIQENKKTNKKRQQNEGELKE